MVSPFQGVLLRKQRTLDAESDKRLPFERPARLLGKVAASLEGVLYSRRAITIGRNLQVEGSSLAAGQDLNLRPSGNESGDGNRQAGPGMLSWSPHVDRTGRNRKRRLRSQSDPSTSATSLRMERMSAASSRRSAMAVAR